MSTDKHKPPPTLRFRFCSTCGMLAPSNHNPNWHKSRNGRGRCPGATTIFVYKREGS